MFWSVGQSNSVTEKKHNAGQLDAHIMRNPVFWTPVKILKIDPTKMFYLHGSNSRKKKSCDQVLIIVMYFV